MAKAKHSANVINDTAAKLAAMLCGERTYRPDEVPSGYCDPAEVIKRTGLSSVQAKRLLRTLHDAGKIDRVPVRLTRGVEYWYNSEPVK